jgi:hypothetical protein
MITFAPPAVRTVQGTQHGHAWVIANPTVHASRPLAAGTYRVTLSPRDLQLGQPELDPWTIRFASERELEARANPD